MSRSFRNWFFSLSLGPVFLALPATAAEVPAPEAGIAVEARGPIHEAFAAPVTAAPKAGLIIVPRQPSAPIPEEPPEQKPAGENVIWVPGYWAWDSDRADFVWVSGLWRAAPKGRRWVPGYWNKVEDGYQWVSGFWSAAAKENLSYLPEPPASQDSGPNVPAPDADSNWVPGTWVWRDGQFVWSPGYWLGQQAGRVWTPATYVWTPCGYVFVGGYWDYPLADRGVLFAPVVFTQPLWTTPGWAYTPSYCVDVPGLLSSFWVRPGYGHYYFGDWYGAGYGRLGFSPWLTFGPRRFDPLYGYYRWRNGPGFINNLNTLQAGRISGDLVRPGRTLAEQNRVIANNPSVQRTVNSFSQVLSGGTVNVTNLTATQRTQESQLAQSIHDVRQQRHHRRAAGSAGREPADDAARQHSAGDFGEAAGLGAHGCEDKPGARGHAGGGDALHADGSGDQHGERRAGRTAGRCSSAGEPGPGGGADDGPSGAAAADGGAGSCGAKGRRWWAAQIRVDSGFLWDRLKTCLTRGFTLSPSPNPALFNRWRNARFADYRSCNSRSRRRKSSLVYDRL